MSHQEPPPAPAPSQPEGDRPSDDEAARLLAAGLSEPGSGAGREPPMPPSEMQAHFPELTIEAVVGQGGMGVVYRARQKRLDRLVALKVLPQALGRDPAFAERFLREARTLARLDHAHIVRVHDFGEREGHFYLLMEFVDGASLRQLMVAGRMAPEEALAIVPQLCQALQYAHDHGVVHRDIKPENVLIDSRGQVKVADFGLAKLIQPDAKDVTLTGTHQVMGTLHYMAPEQYRTPQDVDHRADIFSLGVVFYEMLTGDLPVGNFKQPSQSEAMDQRIDAIVMRALQRERELRYQQASAVQQDVTRISQGGGSQPHHTTHGFRERRQVRHEARKAARRAARDTMAAAGLRVQRESLVQRLTLPGVLALLSIALGFIVCAWVFFDTRAPEEWLRAPMPLEQQKHLAARPFAHMVRAGWITWGAGLVLGVLGLILVARRPDSRRAALPLGVAVFILAGLVVGVALFAADRTKAAERGLEWAHERTGPFKVDALENLHVGTMGAGMSLHPKAAKTRAVLERIERVASALVGRASSQHTGFSRQLAPSEARRFYTRSGRSQLDRMDPEVLRQRGAAGELGFPLVCLPASWTRERLASQLYGIVFDEGRTRAYVVFERGTTTGGCSPFLVTPWAASMERHGSTWDFTAEPIVQLEAPARRHDAQALFEHLLWSRHTQARVIRFDGTPHPDAASLVKQIDAQLARARAYIAANGGAPSGAQIRADRAPLYAPTAVAFIRRLDPQVRAGRIQAQSLGLPLLHASQWQHPMGSFRLRSIQLAQGERKAAVEIVSGAVTISFSMMRVQEPGEDPDRWYFAPGPVQVKQDEVAEARQTESATPRSPSGPAVIRWDGTAHPNAKEVHAAVGATWAKLRARLTTSQGELDRQDLALGDFYTQKQIQFLKSLETEDYNARRNLESIGLPLVDRRNWPHPPDQFQLQQIQLERGEQRAAVTMKSGSVALSFWMLKEQERWYFLVGDVQFTDVETGERR